MPQIVVVQSHCDYSGIVNTWGPFRTEAEAVDFTTELKSAGVDGFTFDRFPLRSANFYGGPTAKESN